jgi:protein ImuB
MNFAVLFATDFALQAVRRADPELLEQPVALVTGEARKAIVAQVSPEARAVEPGLAVTLAFARCPGLIVRPRDLNAEAEASRLLLAAAFTLSPRVEQTGDGWCTIDLQGADATNTEARMHACVADLAGAGISVRVGAAHTPLLAYYAAQRADPVRVVRDVAQFLQPLPLHVAEPTHAQAAILRNWGITTLGQLTALPKDEVGKRLGTDGVLLWERAVGQTTRVLRLVVPAKTFMAQWEYEPPIESMEPLLFRLGRFAECVALELRGASLVAEKLSLALLLEDDEEHRRDFRLPEPSAKLDAWMRVFHAHLENVTTPARIVGARLVAVPARPPEKQDGLFETGLRDASLFWENLARVGAIVGDDCVGTPVVLDTWKPDSVVLEKPAETVPPPETEPVHPPHGLTLRRFRPPWPARVDLAMQRPVTIEAESLHETAREVLGPFRLSGHWWKPSESWRAEIWQVETCSGVIYQIARHAEGWCVEGVLD